MTMTSYHHFHLNTEKSFCFHRYYKVAIALNNNGVCLLQQSCFDGAKKSFRSALEVMKLCINYDSNNRIDGNDDASVETTHHCLEAMASNTIRKNDDIVSNNIRSASQRLAEVRDTKKTKTSQPLQIDTAQQITEHTPLLSLQVLLDDGTLTSLSKAALETDVLGVEGAEDDSKLLAIYIDDQDGAIIDDYQYYGDVEAATTPPPTFDLEVAILLNNLCIALQCSSADKRVTRDSDIVGSNDDQVDNIGSNHDELHDGSPVVQLYQMAYNNLVDYYELLLGATVRRIDDDYNQRHTQLLMMIVLQNIIQISLQLQHSDDAFDYYREICHVRREYVTMSGQNPSPNILDSSFICRLTSPAA